MVYQKETKNWKENNIFVLKNTVKDVLDRYWVKWLLEYVVIDENDDKFQQVWEITHPKQRAKILLNKQEIWLLVTLHPYYHKEFKIPEKAQITYLQLDLEKLIELKSRTKAKPVVKTQYYTLEDQIVSRDLSFVIPKNENYGKVLFAVSKIKEILDVEVFDIYDLWEEKSISLTIKIYWEKMTNDDINKVMDKAIKEAEKVWAKLR
jgi:phenylalanyl-tRNA synthetase beta subunit